MDVVEMFKTFLTDLWHPIWERQKEGYNKLEVWQKSYICLKNENIKSLKYFNMIIYLIIKILHEIIVQSECERIEYAYLCVLNDFLVF